MIRWRNLAVVFAVMMTVGTSTALANGVNPSPGGGVVPIEELRPATLIPKPVLTPVGGELIFSDSPESFDEEGAFYRDTADGEFRVFWHHQNTSGRTMTVAVAMTNETDEPVMLFSKGSGIGTSVYPDIAGQLAINDFMRTLGTTRLIEVLEPGEHYFIETPTGGGLTTSGMAQFEAVSQHAHRPAAVTVTVMGYEVKPDDPLQMQILPAGAVTVRGKFEHFDRLGTIHYDPAMGNAYRPIDSAASGPWQDAMPNEYEIGWSAVDHKEVLNNGNFGVLYRWNIDMTNAAGQPRTVRMYLNPSGGFGHYTIQWSQQIYYSPFVSYTGAWNFTSFTLGAGGGKYRMLTSLTGGSFGPQTIYFTAE